MIKPAGTRVPPAGRQQRHGDPPGTVHQTTEKVRRRPEFAPRSVTSGANKLLPQSDRQHGIWTGVPAGGSRAGEPAGTGRPGSPSRKVRSAAKGPAAKRQRGSDPRRCSAARHGRCEPCASGAPCPSITMVPRRCLGACRGKESGTRIHADQAGCTGMARSPGHGVSREPVSIQPRSACIRLICVHLRSPCFAAAGTGARAAH